MEDIQINFNLSTMEKKSIKSLSGYLKYPLLILITHKDEKLSNEN